MNTDGTLGHSSTLTPCGCGNASRLSSVRNGVYAADCSYLDYSSLVTNIFFKKNNTTGMATSKNASLLNCLQNTRGNNDAKNQSEFRLV